MIYDGIAGHGADVVAGISLFRDESQKLKVESPFLLTAASISWGFVVPKELDGQVLSPNAFLSHNLGIRKSVFNQHLYREDLGRTCAGSFLFNSLLESGAILRLQTEQRVAHNFSFWWWLSPHCLVYLGRSRASRVGGQNCSITQIFYSHGCFVSSISCGCG